jgi:hypothetical protein
MAVIHLYTHAHTHTRYLLVIRVLLQKLIVPQLVKKFAAIFGTRKFITVAIRAHLRSLFRDRRIKSKPSHPVFLSFVIIFSSMLRFLMYSS